VLVTGLTLVGEGLNETINPVLRKRRLLPVLLPPREMAEATGALTGEPTTEDPGEVGT